MRIRTVKPEFFTHEAIFEAELESGLPLRLAFIGLWCAADRDGCFKWEPRRLGVQILPYDSVDFSRVLHALTTRGFIVAYRVNGDVFGFIPSFKRHQVINNREAESILPSPDSENAELLANPDEINACPTRAQRVPHATLTCTSGREGKGRERKGREEDSLSPSVKDEEPEKPKRARNPLMDWLAQMGGAKLEQVTPTAWSGIRKVLSEIQSVTPDVTPDELARRSKNLELKWGFQPTATALAKHWADADQMPVKPKFQADNSATSSDRDWSKGPPQYKLGTEFPETPNQ